MSLLTRVVSAFEHYEPGIYHDRVGLPTIGYGHLIQSGEEFSTPLSRGAALLLLEKDLQVARRTVDRLFRGVFLSEHEWDALTSFTFNVGEQNLATSTLRQKVMHGDLHSAGHEFLRWVFATRKTDDGPVKVKLPGPVKRRDIESCWFLGAHADTVTPAYEIHPPGVSGSALNQVPYDQRQSAPPAKYLKRQD